MSFAQRFLSYALSIRAIEFIPGGRKLKSGRISPYFFNSGKFTNCVALNQLALGYVGAIENYCSQSEDHILDVAFGPSYKGSAIAIATTMASGSKMEYAYDRKETKDHGEGGDVVGAVLKGKRIGLFDDVMTTGGSLVYARDFVEKRGGIPRAAFIAFDRQERGINTHLSAVQEFEQVYELPVFAIATAKDLMQMISEPSSEYHHMHSAMVEYLKQYGV